MFFAVLTLTFVLLLSWLFGYVRKKELLAIVITLCAANILFFWVPFITINYSWYGRAVVGPVGQDLVEGLGEFENQWGYKLNDEWIADYIGKKYNVPYGTVAFDDAAVKEFNQAFAQHRMLFFINMLKRMPDLIAPGLQWLHYKKSPYEQCITTVDKINVVFSSWPAFVDFVLRHLLIRLFFLCGYIGMVIALYHRRYFELLLIGVGIICAGFGKLPSHIEYRYLIPFYWGFSFFVGYAIACARRVLAIK